MSRPCEDCSEALFLVPLKEIWPGVWECPQCHAITEDDDQADPPPERSRVRRSEWERS